MQGAIYKKELLIVTEQPDLMAEVSQLDSDEGIPEIVWAMAVYDFNKQNIIMTKVDYSVVCSHISELCKFHSNAVGLEGHWHVQAGMNVIGMNNLDIENFQSPNTQIQILLDKPSREAPFKFSFHAIGILIHCL